MIVLKMVFRLFWKVDGCNSKMRPWLHLVQGTYLDDLKEKCQETNFISKILTKPVGPRVVIGIYVGCEGVREEVG